MRVIKKVNGEDDIQEIYRRYSDFHDLNMLVKEKVSWSSNFRNDDPSWQGVLNATLYDKFCQWLLAVRWFSQSTPVSSINKTDRHDITEILLEVVLNTLTLYPTPPIEVKVKDN